MPYVERQLKALEDPQLQAQRGNVGHVCVQHDRWCGILHGARSCQCDPDMLLLTADGGRFEITRAGTLAKPRNSLICRHGFDPRFNSHVVN
jgi:hypothetical protein